MNNSFTEYLHPKFMKVLGQIVDTGYEVAIVGGTVRDFYLGLPNKHDYDLEVRPQTQIMSLGSIKDKFKDDYELEILPYEIIRINHSDFSVEMSLPRIEKFNDSVGHSNFEVEFVKDPSYATSSRRDFTINAIYHVFKNSCWDVVDPLKGLDDLKSKKLVSCGPDFSKDPVRYLRGIRFHLKYDFDLTFSMPNDILRTVSKHYLVTEVSKSGRPLRCFSELGLLKWKDVYAEYEKCFENNLEDFIRYLPWTTKSDKVNLLETLGFSVKAVPVFEKSIITKEEYKLDPVTLYRRLDKLPENIFNIYNKFGLIDISFKDFGRIKGLKEFDKTLSPTEIYLIKFKNGLND